MDVKHKDTTDIQLQTEAKGITGQSKIQTDNQKQKGRRKAHRPSEELADLAESIFACFTQSS